MKSNKENQVRLSEEILNNQLIAKKLVKKERDKKRKKLEKIRKFFKQEDASKLFESDSTIVKEQDVFEPKADFTYYKLNLEYLNSKDFNLRYLESKVIKSKTGRKIAYIEYYLNDKEAYMIFVKYNFKHIRLYSENNKTDLNTFVFINTSTEIYYYDEFLQSKLLTQYQTGMDINCAKEILLNKEFKVLPVNETRTYEMITSKKSEILPLKDIHLIIKYLLDIFLEQYRNDIVPSVSDIEIESHFLGTTQECISVQSKVMTDYKDAGVIECCENLQIYEISLYFSDMLNKKVTAKLYLTENEKNKVFKITNKYLNNAVFEDNDEKMEKECLEVLFEREVIKKRMKLIISDIKNSIKKCINIEEYLCEFPVLKDTFGKIYMEYFKVCTEKFQDKNPLKLIRNSILKFDNSSLVQSNMYYMIYQGEVYLIEIYSQYEAYAYENSFKICIPAFGVSSIRVRILEPVTQMEISEFVNKKDKKWASRREINFDINQDFWRYNLKIAKKRIKRSLEDIFPDFIITNLNESGENINEYQIMDICSKEVYEEILDSIQKADNGHFKCLDESIYWGDDDYNENRKRIDIISDNNINYGYYIYNDDNIRTVKMSLYDKDKEVSKGEKLLKIQFKNNSSFYKTTFHHLIKGSEIRKIEYNIASYEIFKLCIDFLLEHQDEIFSE